MSEYKYTKSYATDFSSQLVNHQLQEVIEADTNITTTILRVDRTGDVVDIVFESEPSVGEKTLIDAHIASHSSMITEEPDDQFVMIPKKDYYNNKTYTRFLSFEYIGSNIKRITGISVKSYVQKSDSTYSILVEDDSGGNTIAENTFTNMTEQYNVLTPLSSIPSTTANITFSVKSPGKDKVYIDSIIIYLKHS